MPIPVPRSPVRFEQVRWNGGSLGELAEDLTRKKIAGGNYCHLDPDLDPDALPRLPGWRPAFGQAGAAQGHLGNQEIGSGDLFLFFGWFKRVEKSGNRWRHVRAAPDLHRIFGWLQVEEILTVGPEIESLRILRPWLAAHPHMHTESEFSRNTIYIAATSLHIAGRKTGLPGGGVFRGANKHLVLTEPRQRLRSRWRLPSWFLPVRGGPILSYHEDASRWRRDARWRYLRSTPIGQEFVIDISEIPAASDWLENLFAGAA